MPARRGPPASAASAASAPWAIWGAVALAATTPAQAGGDVERGRLAYEARCGGCHSVQADRAGPRHAGLFGRRAGSVPGFGYSPALKSSRIVWNAETIERWLRNPEALVPGQAMGVSVADAAVRANIVAYLETLGTPR